MLRDAHAERAERWTVAHAHAPLVVSHWTAPEVSSALALRVRSGVLTESGRDRALAGWHRMQRDTLRTLAVDTAHFARAAALVDRHALGLRAPDALHLAIAEATGATMVTFDDRLAEACRALGVALSEI